MLKEPPMTMNSRIINYRFWPQEKKRGDIATIETLSRDISFDNYATDYTWHVVFEVHWWLNENGSFSVWSFYEVIRGVAFSDFPWEKEGSSVVKNFYIGNIF